MEQLPSFHRYAFDIIFCRRLVIHHSFRRNDRHRCLRKPEKMTNVKVNLTVGCRQNYYLNCCVEWNSLNSIALVATLRTLALQLLFRRMSTGDCRKMPNEFRLTAGFLHHEDCCYMLRHGVLRGNKCNCARIRSHNCIRNIRRSQLQF